MTNALIENREVTWKVLGIPFTVLLLRRRVMRPGGQLSSLPAVARPTGLVLASPARDKGKRQVTGRNTCRPRVCYPAI